MLLLQISKGSIELYYFTSYVSFLDFLSEHLAQQYTSEALLWVASAQPKANI